MKIAAVSDIHANLPALEAVVGAIDASGVDEIWCLGDVVGYGASPNECAALIAERCDVCLAGNHDLVVTGAIDISTFSPSAAEAARWTIDAVSDPTREFLQSLEPDGERADIGLFHGSPRNPVWEYVLSVEAAQRSLETQTQRVGLIGHSHVACWFCEREELAADQGRNGERIELASGRWLVNPGSVGQPRDSDPRAAFLMLDTDSGEASFERVEYPIEKAAEAIVAAGLPGQLGQRLFTGQ